jgi:hypothetical protein
MFEALFFLFLMLLAIGAVGAGIEYVQAQYLKVKAQYLKATRFKRQRHRFEQVQKSIRERGLVSRESLLGESQRADVEELASIVKEQLEKFSIDIPPRLIQDARESIDKYVENIEFGKLYDLYTILGHARKNTVFQELNRFFNWGYMK